MKKERFALHLVSILVILLFAFMAISSSTTTPDVVESSVTTTSEGTTTVSRTTTGGHIIYNMPQTSGKDYVTLGLVFATSVTEYDENDRGISSQEGITTMLLREAQRLGGDDILNLRIDENTTYVITTTEITTISPPTVVRRTVTQTGSALAIKYTDSIPETENTSSRFIPQTATIEGMVVGN